MRVLIAGCGYVGTALGQALAARGDTPYGLRRDPTGLPAPILPVAADLNDPGSLDDLPPVDAVVLTMSPGGRDTARYRTTYVDGPTTLLRVLADRGDELQRVLFTSSTAVYGERDGGWVDEASPTDPTSDTARVLVEAERTVLAGPYPATALRLGGIYGPGRTRMLERVRAGEVRCPPQVEYTNRIHRDDAAGALAHLLTVRDPDDVYLGVDSDPADRCTVYRWLADRLGVAPPSTDPGGSSRRGSKRCRNDRLLASGYRLRFPSFRDGYGTMLAADGVEGDPRG